MRALLEHMADVTLSRSPVQRYFHWRAADRLTVLAYHDVADAERFEAHLRYFTRACHPVSLEDVLAAVDGRRGLPRRAVLVTFDDGDRSVLDVGLPLLQAWDVPAVVFVVAGLVGTDRPFWWEEVRALAAGGAYSRFGAATPGALAKSLKYVPDEERERVLDLLREDAASPAPPRAQLRPEELRTLESGGVAVGNHTLTHPCLSHCPEDKIAREVHEAHDRLTRYLGHAPTAFAYPNGDEDRRVTAEVARAGYRAAFLFDHRLSERPPHDPLRISRVRVNSDATVDRLRLIASGLHPALLRVRHRGALPGAAAERAAERAGRREAPSHDPPPHSLTPS